MHGETRILFSFEEFSSQKSEDRIRKKPCRIILAPDSWLLCPGYQGRCPWLVSAGRRSSPLRDNTIMSAQLGAYFKKYAAIIHGLQCRGEIRDGGFTRGEFCLSHPALALSLVNSDSRTTPKASARVIKSCPVKLGLVVCSTNTMMYFFHVNLSVGLGCVPSMVTHYAQKEPILDCVDR